ncbi:hypothetical protein PHET_10211 [Paragonimus heterotremus]|uniref:TAP-C domain-containing protein n=1 Tax=Paragonimus heterotremus TaxID=100268 RepID=A0A8J4T838_9TREM|nr:hypothetical protein PHET_10211 [Paragonimus heterotremus]
MVFTVAGVFYEVQEIGDGPSTPNTKCLRKILRCFSRTMILVAPGGHIIQDDFIISNPSPALCKKYITNVACNSQTHTNNSTSVPPQSGPQLNAAVSTADPNTQLLMVAELRQRSGMNEAYSRQCLEEYHWNLDAALNAFQNLNAAGKLPSEAFT